MKVALQRHSELGLRVSLLFILIKKLNYCIMERKNENYVVLIVNRRNAEVKKEEIVALLKMHPEFKVLTGVLNSYFDSYVIVKCWMNNSL